MAHSYDDSPRDPVRLMSLAYFLSTIGAGILLANNWPRLGKREWRGTTIMLSLVVPLGSIALAGGVVWLCSALDAASLFFIPIFAAFGANLGFVWALMRLQRPAYTKFDRQGKEAMLAHQYNVHGAVVFGATCVVACVVGGGIMAALYS